MCYFLGALFVQVAHRDYFGVGALGVTAEVGVSNAHTYYAYADFLHFVHFQSISYPFVRWFDTVRRSSDACRGNRCRPAIRDSPIQRILAHSVWVSNHRDRRWSGADPWDCG